MSATIHSSKEINGGKMAVIATITGPVDQYAASLSAATNNSMSCIAQTMRVLGDNNMVKVVRAIMKPAKQVLPANHAGQMVALSSNMFMDASERIWHLKSEGADGILVAQQPENLEELMGMMQSCSSDTSGNPMVREAMMSTSSAIDSVEGGDVASYVSESGELEVGFVAYTSAESSEVGIVSFSGDHHVVDRQALVTVRPCNLMQYPDEVALSVSGVVTGVPTLLDYYKRVYSYNSDYWNKIRQVIVGHSF